MSDIRPQTSLQVQASWMPRFMFPLFKTIEGTLSLDKRRFTFTDRNGQLLVEIPVSQVKKIVHRGSRGKNSVWIVSPLKKQPKRLAFLINRGFIGKGNHTDSEETDFKKWKTAFQQLPNS